jgi:hypothetical protein
LIMSLAAMARPSRRFGGPRARCADKQGFPSWMRPGHRPPVQRSNNRPLMWNCCRQLKDRPGQPGGPSMFLGYTSYNQSRGLQQQAVSRIPRRASSLWWRDRHRRQLDPSAAAHAQRAGHCGQSAPPLRSRCAQAQSAPASLLRSWIARRHEGPLRHIAGTHRPSTWRRSPVPTMS